MSWMVKKSPENAQLHCLLGRAYLGAAIVGRKRKLERLKVEKLLEQAQRYARAAIAQAPGDYRNHILMARTLANSGASPVSVYPYAKKAYELAPEVPEIALFLGRNYLSQGQTKSASILLKRIAIDPTTSPASEHARRLLKRAGL